MNVSFKFYISNKQQQKTQPMIRQIRLDKFPKKATSFRPQILNSLLLLERTSYDGNTHKFQTFDQQYELNYQLYVAKKLNRQVEQNIEFIQYTPNLLILQNQPFSLIIEEQYQQTLKEYMAHRQYQIGLPFINEVEAKQVLLGIAKPLQSFEKHNIDYNTLSDFNVLRFKNKWTLSLASLISYSFANDKNFYDSKKKGKECIVYAIGSLLFKMLFGFVPFEQNPKKPSEFKFSNYIKSLEEENYKKILKIYYFAERIQLISNRCKGLIEDSLSGKIINIEQFFKHSFFTEPPESPIKEGPQNREIKMINYFDKKYHSLIMACIDRRKKNPYEKLHPKIQADKAGFLDLKENYSKDPFLRMLIFAPLTTESELKRAQQSYDNLIIDCKYFERDFQFGEGQRPTLQLIKLIDKDRSKFPDLYQKQDRQSMIKLYAFPYVMVFQLANVYREQSVQMKKKIEQLIPLLFQVSSLQGPAKNFVRLHNFLSKKLKFQDIKLKYRELINSIYKVFLTQAMKRYNAKKQNLTIAEKMKLKEEGLQYYRLCLKLMEASLVVRKGGKDLDLQRIQTSQRKQIEQDLQNILKTYFPNRVEIK